MDQWCYKMRYSRRRIKRVILPHSITVEDASEQEYETMVNFLKENVPTTDRSTPKFLEPHRTEDRTTKLVFRFRHEEQAMAFKLIV